MVFFFRMPPFTGSRSARSTDAPAPLGSAYGHNARIVNHNTIISRGSQSADLGADFHPLDSHEDTKYYNDNVPLKIFKRQEVLVTSQGPEASGASEASVSSPPSSSADRVSLKI